jgi:DNA-binding NarL/FixJ family response regulator
VKTILIVDDHVGFRSTARTVLEAEGFDVVGEAGDGAEAVELAKRLRPDVVLLDVQLPDMDGFEIASRLSLNGHGPAIVLTSSRDAGEFGNLIDLSPARGFVPKAELSGRRLAALLE